MREISGYKFPDTLVLPMLLIFRAQVENKDISTVEEIVRQQCRLLEDKRSYVVFNLTISGYDKDERELYEIPEVIEWVKLVHSRFPALSVFLSPASLTLFLACLVPVQVNRPKFEIVFPNAGQVYYQLLDMLHSGYHFLAQYDLDLAEAYKDRMLLYMDTYLEPCAEA